MMSCPRCAGTNAIRTDNCSVARAAGHRRIRERILLHKKEETVDEGEPLFTITQITAPS